MQIIHFFQPRFQRNSPIVSARTRLMLLQRRPCTISSQAVAIRPLLTVRDGMERNTLTMLLLVSRTVRILRSNVSISESDDDDVPERLSRLVQSEHDDGTNQSSSSSTTRIISGDQWGVVNVTPVRSSLSTWNGFFLSLHNRCSYSCSFLFCLNVVVRTHFFPRLVCRSLFTPRTRKTEHQKTTDRFFVFVFPVGESRRVDLSLHVLFFLFIRFDSIVCFLSSRVFVFNVHDT